MAHKSLIGGTTYNISGGKSLISGTSYNIYKFADFDNYKIEWNVFRYWSNMDTFINDDTTAPLYANNPTYSAGYYNKELNIVHFEGISVVEDLILNNTIVLNDSGGVFAKIGEEK